MGGEGQVGGKSFFCLFFDDDKTSTPKLCKYFESSTPVFRRIVDNPFSHYPNEFCWDEPTTNFTSNLSTFPPPLSFFHYSFCHIFSPILLQYNPLTSIHQTGLNITPNGPNPIQLWFNSASLLPPSHNELLARVQRATQDDQARMQSKQ